MRIALLSDTHLGLTQQSSLVKMLKNLQNEAFDLLVHAGDYNGGENGARALKSTLKLIREYFPSKEIVSVIGNHDYWSSSKRNTPRLEGFINNYNDIKNLFKENKVHFLDEDGVYIHKNYPNIKFVGHTGWYSNINPPTNDMMFLPLNIEGHTHAWLNKRANTMLDLNLKQLDVVFDKNKDKLVFISHFPVVKSKLDVKNDFEKFSWSNTISTIIKESYSCKYFLEGHSHIYANGPYKYNCGSDYSLPKYLMVEIK